MSMYQPALDSYQHGLDQSLAGMFKLASQPTPAQTFLDSLQQREQTDWQRQMQEQAQDRAWQEQQRKAGHEDYLWAQLGYNNENKAADRAVKKEHYQDVSARGWDRNSLKATEIDDKYEQGKIALDLRRARQERQDALAKAQMAHMVNQDAAKQLSIQRATDAKNRELELKGKYFQLAKDRLDKMGTVSPSQLFAETSRMRRGLKTAGLDDDEIDSEIQGFMDQYAPKVQTTAPPSAQPSAQATAPQGKAMEPELQRKYDSIVDPAKKAEAKRRLMANGYLVP